MFGRVRATLPVAGSRSDRYDPGYVVDADRKGTIDELPKFKPPFDGPSTFAAPDGMGWVRRTTAAADSIGRYDVLDQSGRLAGRVSLGYRARLVGFGRSSVYVVRRDSDDLEYVGRTGLPKI